MKSIFFLFSITLLFACTAPKNTNDISEKPIPEGYTKVIVLDTKSPDACDFLLKLNTEDVYLFPVAMEDRFKINKKTLYIKYRPSRISQRNCKKGKTVILEDVIVP